MSAAEYEALVQENQDLNKALGMTKKVVEEERREKEDLMKVHEEYKTQFERISKELMLSQKKLTEEIVGKRQRKEQNEAEQDRLKDEINR